MAKQGKVGEAIPNGLRGQNLEIKKKNIFLYEFFSFMNSKIYIFFYRYLTNF